MLKESPKFAYMRFVHQDCEAEGGFTTSCGSLGRFFYDDMSRTLKEDRRRLLAKRSLALITAEKEKDDDNTSSEDASDGSDGESDSDDSASDIEPDSDDEALLQERQSGTDDGSDNSMNDSRGNSRVAPNGDTSGAETNDDGGSKKETESPTEVKTISELIDAPGLESVLCKQESTRHLAYGLLGVDIGYSSDEGGDEDVAYYVSSKILDKSHSSFSALL